MAVVRTHLGGRVAKDLTALSSSQTPSTGAVGLKV